MRHLWQRAVRFQYLPGAERADVLRALVELARARRQLHRIPAARVAQMDVAHAAPTEAQQQAAARVGRAITRAAAVAPWRADCLIQALAARSWLDRQAIPTRLRLGARPGGPQGRPDAHAWLLCGEVVVTGGDIAPFRPFAPMPPRGQSDPKRPDSRQT